MRNRNLVTRLWLATSLLLLLVLIPLEVALHQVLVRFYESQVTEPLLYHSRQLAILLAQDPEAIQLAPVMGQMVGGEVIVLDGAGQPLSFTGASALTPPQDGVAEILAGHSFVGQARTPAGKGFIVTGVPVPILIDGDPGRVAPGVQGGVLLMAPADPVQHSLQVARRYLWGAGGLILLLGTGLALLLARSLTRPILTIERATRAIARGDFSVRVPVTAADEIGRLGQAVNQMTAQLDAYETRRREFLANVAHELRTPLSYIRGYTQALAEGLVPDPQDQARYQQIVLDESLRLGRLVDDLMDLAQIEEGQMGFELLPLDLRLPVEQAVATILPRAQTKGVQLHVALPPELPTPLADGGRIQQVLFNLVDNALRHTPAGGGIWVRADATPEVVTVRVTDSGEGVEHGLLPSLFDRFQSGRQGGRGLGLAVVRSIIRAHGGQVGAESQPGQGATFWFQLPLKP